MDYLSKIKNIGELYLTEIDDMLDLLEEKDVIYKDHTHNMDMQWFQDQEYIINDGFIKWLIKNNTLYNYLLGFGEIINHYQNSVYKIEVCQEGKVGIGTGWIIDIIDDDKRIRVLVTNQHVIANTSYVKVYNKSDEVVKHYKIEEFHEQGVDVAFIILDYNKDIPDFSLGFNTDLLSEVVTIGYPSIPMSRAAFQVVHRGELNAQINDYSGQELIVISARTAPGNSGSPVLDENGLVVGMVTRELFEKSAFKEKGIVPYSACIP